MLPGLDDDLMDIDIDQDVLDMLRNAAVKGRKGFLVRRTFEFHQNVREFFTEFFTSVYN